MTEQMAGVRVVDLREQVQGARTAAVAARQAARAARQAQAEAGALAGRRAAADREVAEAVRRLRAVRGLRPRRVLLAVRGGSAVERLRRADDLLAARGRRAEIVEEVRARLAEAHRLSRQAETSAAVAAALPRLLDELARAICEQGGEQARRLAAAEASLAPPLGNEIVISRTLQALRHARGRVARSAERLSGAGAWSGEPVGPAVATVTAAVLTLRRDVPQLPVPLREATDTWLCWSASRAPDAVPAGLALEQARLLLVRLEVIESQVRRQRTQVRRLVAGTRALRTGILQGAA